jgi:hypothetical protein
MLSNVNVYNMDGYVDVMAGDEPQDIAPITLPRAHGMECSLKYLRKFAID